LLDDDGLGSVMIGVICKSLYQTSASLYAARQSVCTFHVRVRRSILNAGFKVLIATVTKIFTFWDMTHYSPLKIT
jgi:hypothetical protein